MKKIIKIDVWIRSLIAACIAMVLLPIGCVNEDRDDCEYESLIYIVVETENTDFVTQLDGATLYLFDSNGAFLRTIPVSGADIAGNVPIPITYDRDDIPWVVVWGNLSTGEHIIMPTSLQTMENIYVSMVSGADGYTLPADNLFYGMKRLSGESVERVVVTPKTGTIAITVMGLADVSSSYYFTIHSSYDHYDCFGTPIAGDVLMYIPGIFEGTTLVSAQPCHLFHFPPSTTEEETLIVNVYRINSGTGEIQLLTTVNVDMDGNPIRIEREKTTNVLIYFIMGDLRVTVEVTEWGRIHQWEHW